MEAYERRIPSDVLRLAVSVVLWGATLVATISNLMNVMNVDSYWQPLVIGLIILAGVTFDTMRSSNRLKFPWAKGKKSAKS